MRHTACWASGVWLAQGWQITRGPDTPSRPCRALVGPAWLGPSSPAARGSNGTRQPRPGGGARETVDTRSSATIPPNNDGRWLCMRCGLHNVRHCDLRKKRCAEAPANQAAAKAVADALAGGPLTRRKVHAFAKHPSGSRPGAPGARLPSDVVELDPAAPKPDGPACLRAQVVDPGNQGAAAPRGDLQQTLPASDPGSHGGPEPHCGRLARDTKGTGRSAAPRRETPSRKERPEPRAAPPRPGAGRAAPPSTRHRSTRTLSAPTRLANVESAPGACALYQA